MTTETIIRYTVLAMDTVMSVTFVACMAVSGYGLVLRFWRRVMAQESAAAAEEKATS